MLDFSLDFGLVDLLAGAAAVVLALLAPHLRRRYSARALSALWMVLAVWLVVPVHVALKAAPVQLSVPSSFAAPMEGTMVSQPAIQAVVGQSGGIEKQGAAASSPQNADEPRALTLRQSLLLIWLTGAVLLAAYQALAFWQWTRRVRRWDLPAGETIQQVNRAAAQAAGAKLLPVRQNASVTTPMLSGMRHPVLRVPQRMDPAEAGALELMLRHEYAHFCAKDLYKKLLLQSAVCLHWYNPAVWLLRRMGQRELEFACDETVLRGIDAARRAQYGEALLYTAAGRAPCVTSQFGGEKMELKHRLENLFRQHKRRGIALVLCCAVGLAVCGGLTACGRSTAASGQAADQTQPTFQTSETGAAEENSSIQSKLMAETEALAVARGSTAASSQIVIDKQEWETVSLRFVMDDAVLKDAASTEAFASSGMTIQNLEPGMFQRCLPIDMTSMASQSTETLDWALEGAQKGDYLVGLLRLNKSEAYVWNAHSDGTDAQTHFQSVDLSGIPAANYQLIVVNLAENAAPLNGATIFVRGILDPCISGKVGFSHVKSDDGKAYADIGLCINPDETFDRITDFTLRESEWPQMEEVYVTGAQITQDQLILTCRYAGVDAAGTRHSDCTQTFHVPLTGMYSGEE